MSLSSKQIKRIAKSMKTSQIDKGAYEREEMDARDWYFNAESVTQLIKRLGLKPGQSADEILEILEEDAIGAEDADNEPINLVNLDAVADSLAETLWKMSDRQASNRRQAYMIEKGDLITVGIVSNLWDTVYLEEGMENLGDYNFHITLEEPVDSDDLEDWIIANINPMLQEIDEGTEFSDENDEEENREAVFKEIENMLADLAYAPSRYI